MKQTRKIIVSEKVFTAEDLRRIARIFEKQKTLASKSDHNTSVEYEVDLSDHTTLETDSPELFADESLATPARPTAIGMSFRNYTLGRHVRLSLAHGEDSTYTNVAVVSGDESAWVSENFLAIKEAIDRVQPQDFWFRRHWFLLANLIALGLGSLLMLISPRLVALAGSLVHFPELIRPDSPWVQALESASPVVQYVLYWFVSWVVGLIWTRDVLWWLLDMWPSVEFRFGLPHLRTERIRRRRLWMVATLVILPICTNIIAGLIK